jgi:diguanylate cyclase (GGDEF)-like protein
MCGSGVAVTATVSDRMDPRVVSGAAGEQRHRLERAIGQIDSATDAHIVLISVLVGAWVGVADYVTGADLSFSIFYLAPVVLLAWRLGRRAGLAGSVAAAIVWYIVDRLSDGSPANPIIPIWNGFVRLGFFVIVATLTAEIRFLLRQHEEDATVDELTGLLNRRGFVLRSQIEFDRSRRFHTPLSLVYIDLDEFKRINDSRGHAAGDAVLARVGATVRSTLRSVDVAARLGGDEFVLLLTDATEREAFSVLDRLGTALVMPDHEPIRFSSGVVAFVQPPASLDDALLQADQAMYRSKARRRADDGGIDQPSDE